MAQRNQRVQPFGWGRALALAMLTLVALVSFGPISGAAASPAAPDLEATLGRSLAGIARAAGPRAAVPRAAVPRAAVPRATVPRAAVPRAAGPPAAVHADTLPPAVTVPSRAGLGRRKASSRAGVGTLTIATSDSVLDVPIAASGERGAAPAAGATARHGISVAPSLPASHEPPRTGRLRLAWPSAVLRLVRSSTALLVLAAAAIVFLILQSVAGRRNPRLMAAPIDRRESELDFE